LPRVSLAPEARLALTLTEVLIPLATAILAGAVAAVSGFGIGSLLTPVLMLSMPIHEAVALLAIPHLWATVVRLARLRRDAHWPTLRQFGLASAIGGLAGAVLQARLGSPVLTAVLACLLMLVGTTELLQRPLPLPPTRTWRTVGGVLSGVFGGLVGNQGGVRTAALLGFGLTTRALVATATATALLVDLARTPVYLVVAGDVIASELPLVGVLVIGVTIGTFIGVPLLSRIPVAAYRRLVGGMLVLVGVLILLAL
jgi:uncharacterized membrane protein YfcA